MGNLRILSKSSTPFADRQEAGRKLALELKSLAGRGPVVLGIPRGGVIVAAELAARLGGELDVVLSRKLRTPGYPELAMGAVAEGGQVFLNQDVIQSLRVDEEALEREKAVQLQEIARRSSVMRRVAEKIPLQGRTVIITDDGVATGATALVSLREARREQAKKIIIAFPVGPRDTMERLAQGADEVVCLQAPPFFRSVGQFYANFDEVGEDEVIRILKQAREDRVPATTGHPDGRDFEKKK